MKNFKYTIFIFPLLVALLLCTDLQSQAGLYAGSTSIVQKIEDYQKSNFFYSKNINYESSSCPGEWLDDLGTDLDGSNGVAIKTLFDGEPKGKGVEAWRILKDLPDLRNNIDVLNRLVYVRKKTAVWLKGTQIGAFDNAVANSSTILNRINNAAASPNNYYTLEEALEWEVLIWKIQQEGVPLPNQPQLDRLRRFYLHLIGSNPNHSRTPSIALGLSNGEPTPELQNLIGIQPSNTTNFKSFQTKGFTNYSTGLSSPTEIWNAGLIESMWECYQHNGKIYFLLDGVNVNALNNHTIPGFNSSTTKELRYMIKNNLDQLTVNNNGIESTFVEFWIEGSKVSDDHAIFDAINSYRSNSNLDGQVISGPAKPEVQWD